MKYIRAGGVSLSLTSQQEPIKSLCGVPWQKRWSSTLHQQEANSRRRFHVLREHQKVQNTAMGNAQNCRKCSQLTSEDSNSWSFRKDCVKQLT